MQDKSWSLMVPGKFQKRFETIEEVKSAAEQYLRTSTTEIKVLIQEFEEGKGPIRAKVVFKITDNSFRYADLEKLP